MLSCLIARRDHDPALADVTADRTCFNCTFALFLSAAVRLPVVHHSWVDPTAVLTTSTAHTCTYTEVQYCSITELALLLDEAYSSRCGHKKLS